MKLHPAGVVASRAVALGDGQQVGWVLPEGAGSPGTMRAALWEGTAESFRDLTPPRAHGAEALACLGGMQAGHVYSDPRLMRATLWQGHAGDTIDLHARASGYEASTACVLAFHEGKVRVIGAVEKRSPDGRGIAGRWIAVWEAPLRP